MIRLVAKLAGRTVAKGEYDGQPNLTLGTAADSDLVLDGLACSDGRLLILYRDGIYELRDLGAGDVAKVNGKPVSSHNLNDQDLIEIGDVKGAYLIADLEARKDGPVYVGVPPGGIPGMPSDALFEVVRPVYGLAPSGRAFYRTGDKVICGAGFKANKHDA